MNHGGFGRRPAPDPRDHDHLMLMALPTVAPTRPISRVHRIYWKGDQGPTSQCVGYSWHALLRAKPHLQREPTPGTIYHEAQKVDEWPGEDYDGTSVRAGAKVLQAAGKLTAYSWAFDVETALSWLAFHGPLVFGINWYADMERWDPVTGLIKVGGAILGGHAICCLGYDDHKQWLIFQNSWLNWGIKQRFKLSYADAQRLLNEDGECCAPTEALA